MGLFGVRLKLARATRAGLGRLFGTLAKRSPPSRTAIIRCVDAAGRSVRPLGQGASRVYILLKAVRCQSPRPCQG
ncbi:MAG: hypothetical protein MI923_09640 [Phycisphaerales bacterium]|nr:hypothetical protein [Phycisphaerales bacterium]